jgi:class 3 adenylate cyclase
VDKARCRGSNCDNCGAQIEKLCRSCSATNRPDARFCANCGTAFETLEKSPLSAGPDTSGAQQKQVTVLFADISGSTELISRMDAEDAGYTLGSVISVISKAMTRFGGVVIRRMGDGVMVLFGAPVAAEDHAARACFAALAALDAVSRMGDLALPIRVGMCSGPVILRKTGRDDEDYDVAGITAHIAARLEQQAESGTVLLARQTASLVTGIANVESLGQVALKGIAEPLQVFRLLSATDRPSWIVRSGARELSTFVGREDELAQLSLALGRAWAGRAQAIALVADAGMGKSRLLHEFLGNLAQGAWHVMRVETTPQSTAIPYFLITALLREFVGCSQEDTTAEVAAWLPSVIASLGLDPQFDMTPLLAHLDREVEEVGFDKTDPLQRSHRLVQSLRPILLRYADLHPLILVVEDYHWLDASSVEVLDELFGEMDAVRLALLVTTRPERRPGWRHLIQQGDDDSLGPRTEIELKHLTAGTPPALWAIMIPVEIMGTFIKPFALAIRLFANMVAGHTLLATLLMFTKMGLEGVGIFAGGAISLVAMVSAVAVTFLELFVAFLQAFVFMFLVTVFIAQLSHHGHEEHGHEDSHSHDAHGHPVAA